MEIIESFVDIGKSVVYFSFIIKSVIIHRRVLTEMELRLGLGVQSTIIFMLHDAEERKKNMNENEKINIKYIGHFLVNELLYIEQNFILFRE
jgi:hypothetical protein